MENVYGDPIPYDYMITFLAAGDAGVGKTQLVYQYTDEQFSQKYISTVGIDFREKRIQYTPKTNPNAQPYKIHLKIWDAAGQECFRSLTRTFFRDAMGFLLVFDLTSEQSFLSICNWLEEIRPLAYCEDPDMILIGNKVDREDERVITYTRAKELADELSIPYIETSASTSQNLTEAIEILLEKALTRMKEPQDKSIFPVKQGPRIQAAAASKYGHPCYC